MLRSNPTDIQVTCCEMITASSRYDRSLIEIVRLFRRFGKPLKAVAVGSPFSPKQNCSTFGDSIPSSQAFVLPSAKGTSKGVGEPIVFELLCAEFYLTRLLLTCLQVLCLPQIEMLPSKDWYNCPALRCSLFHLRADAWRRGHLGRSVVCCLLNGPMQWKPLLYGTENVTHSRLCSNCMFLRSVVSCDP